MKHRHPRANPQSGLSLIELMIALVVGLVLVAGVLSIFLSSRKSYGINTAVGEIQENARAAINFIRQNTRMAGYLGCGTSDGQFINQLNAAATLPFNFANAITGFEYDGTAPGDSYTPAASATSSSWSPHLDVSIHTSGSNAALPGSDAFAVSISQGITTPSYVSSSTGNDLTLAANNNGLASGDPLIISNCVYTAIRQATGITGLTIATAAGAANTGSLPAQAAQNAQVTTASIVAFYVGIGTDGSPALYEALTDPTTTSGFRPEEIAPGVENMQVLYGVGTATDNQTPAQYLPANALAASDWPNVVSVRVALLMRSAPGAVPRPATAQTYDLLGTSVQAPIDTRLRRVFTATISLRNRLLRP